MSGGGRKFDAVLQDARQRKFDAVLGSPLQDSPVTTPDAVMTKQPPTQEEWDAQISEQAQKLGESGDQPLAGIGVDPQLDQRVLADRAQAAAIAARKPAPMAPTGLEALLPGSAQLPSARERRSAPLRAYNQIPQDGALDRTLNTANDAVMAGQQAALMNLGDNFSQNPEATRRRLELGARRSPTASAIGDTVGTAFTATALAANPILGGALQGGISSAGAADDQDLEGRLEQAAKGALVGTVLGGAGRLVSGTGRMMRAAPETLPALAREITQPAVGWKPGGRELLGFGYDLATGNLPGASKTGALYLGRRVPGVKQALQRGGEWVAENVAPAVGKVAGVVGEAFPSRAATAYGTGFVAQRAGERMGTPDTASKGNLLPEATLNALQNSPQVLGRYRDQIAEAAASPNQGSVGALISRLTQSDPEFRSQVLPALQRMTAEQPEE